jgi:hypothetical protein
VMALTEELHYVPRISSSFNGELVSVIPVLSSKVWWRTSPEQAHATMETFYESLNFVSFDCWRHKHRDSIGAHFID